MASELVAPPVSEGSFSELMKGLGWGPRTVVYMLWAYLDDSGIHDLRTGKLLRLALGGAIATCEVWRDLSSAWVQRLRDKSNPSAIEWFHYKEWKKAHGGHAKQTDAFYGWNRTQLENLLSDLTQIISRRQTHYICASMPAVASKRATRESYFALVKKVLVRTRQIRDWVNSEEKFSLMFSMHSELGGIHVQKMFAMLKKVYPFLGECVIADPRDHSGLQVADLVANEMASARFIRVRFGDGPFQPPYIPRMMQQLQQGPHFHHMVELHDEDDPALVGDRSR